MKYIENEKRESRWEGITQEKFEYALKQYLEDKMSLGKAAKIADISLENAK